MSTASLVRLKSRHAATQLGIGLSVAYACIGVLWIVVSDGVATSIATTPEGLEMVQRYKGFGFVVFTAAAMLVLVRLGHRLLSSALGEATAAVVADLTQQLELRVAERTEELRLVNRELDAFARTAAHDLKTPLSGIIGIAEILRITYKPLLGAEGDRMTSLIQKSAQGMSVLIDDLLALSRVTTTDLVLKRVDLAALAGEVFADLRATDPLREVGVSIRSPMHVQADEGLLRSLMTNLIGNAWKFTAKEASAQIEVGCDDTHEGWVVHFVRDNGAGFEMCEAAKVFEPFHRFHSTRDYVGTGVGLATCQRIVLRHGGSIWISSAPGKGTTVYFSLSRPEVKGYPPCIPEGSFFAASA